MGLYFYKAKNLQGEEITGSLEVATEKQLAQNLRNQGYFLVSFSQESTGGDKVAISNNNDKKRLKSKVSFFSNLSGVPLS